MIMGLKKILFGIKEDPLLSSNFVDDIKSWPNTNIGQIFAYFLENKAYETEYIGQYKLRKAYIFFKSGFVDKLLVKSVEEERTIIRASVTPFQRLNDDKHQPWIVFKSDGSVITGFCICTAGHSRCCNHTAVVLYKLNYANEKGYTKPASTDEICNWNLSSKEINPMKVKDMDILQHNLGKSKQKSFLTYPEKLKFDPRPTTEREIPYVNLENSHSCLEVVPPYQRPPHSIFPLVYPSVRTSHLLLKI